MLDLNKFMSKKAVRRLQGKNLHKIAAHMAGIKGEMDLPAAITLIGTKARVKAASYKNITNGILAMNDLLKEVKNV
jgi:hypothetical protein